MAASPLCTPANSMCCSIPPTTEVSPSDIQSTSNSIASSKNLSNRTGLPGATAKASLTTPLNSSSSYTINIPRPPKTKEGRSKMG